MYIEFFYFVNSNFLKTPWTLYFNIKSLITFPHRNFFSSLFKGMYFQGSKVRRSGVTSLVMFFAISLLSPVHCVSQLDRRFLPTPTTVCLGTQCHLTLRHVKHVESKRKLWQIGKLISSWHYMLLLVAIKMENLIFYPLNFTNLSIY